MNKVILLGNVGKDPESRIVNDTTVTRFSLATNKHKMKDGEKVTDTQWHNIVLWGKVAETASKYVKKGNMLLVEGEISYRSYESNGNRVYVTEIIAWSFEFAGSQKAKEEKKDEASWNDLPF